MNMKPLPIHSAQHDYEVEFFSELKPLEKLLLGVDNGLIVIDRNVERLYRDELKELLSRFPVLAIDATEEEKSFVGVQKVVTWLQSQNASKRTKLIVLGGGITQDIAALSAHIWYRGIDWIFVPTTLLSMSDSCIGAKCGVNLNAYKNQIGAFHSPSRVLISTRFVQTLKDNDVKSGYGEILKLMFTGSAELLAALESAVARDGLATPKLPELLRQSLEVKKKYIEIDEYERDQRRILNYGHTFGHAVETLTDYYVPHGLAVAWGMDLVNFIAMKRGMLSREDFKRAHDFVSKHLYLKLNRKIRPEELLKGAKRDKKASGAVVSLVLAEAPGALKIVPTPIDSKLGDEIAQYLSESDVFA